MGAEGDTNHGYASRGSTYDGTMRWMRLASAALIIVALTLSAWAADAASAMPAGPASSSASPAAHRKPAHRKPAHRKSRHRKPGHRKPKHPKPRNNSREETTFRFEFGAGVHVAIRGGGSGTSNCTTDETDTSFDMTSKVATQRVGFNVKSDGSCGVQSSWSQFRLTVTRGSRTIGTGIVAYGEVGPPFGRFDTFCNDYVTGEVILHGLTCDQPDARSMVISAPGAKGGDASSCEIVASPTQAHHTECSDINLNGIDLTAKNLQWANLEGANLSWANISASSLQHADLKGVNLTDAYLSASNFTDTDMSDADLASADLDGAAFKDAQMKGVASGGISGTPASLPANWTTVGGYLIGPGANLANARLGGLALGGLDLSGVSSGGVTGAPASLPAHWTIVNGYLIGPDVNLTRAKLTNADASKADFSRADLTEADLTGARMKTAVLTDARWDKTICPDGTNSDSHSDTCVGHLSVWSRIRFHLDAKGVFDRPCGGTTFGEVGTQECSGNYDRLPGPDPSFGPWPFTDKHSGTSKASVATPGGQVAMRFYVPGGEIDGTMPSVSSDRYTVTGAIIGNVAPAFLNPVDPSTPAGEKGGPLKIKVTAGGPSGYDFDVEGWVQVP
jgi:uncharacterized protein YjbI with pentapeptide repeats